MKNKKLDSNLLNMALSLFGITLISSALLGTVYNLTKEKIDAAKEAKKLKSISKVIMPGNTNSPAQDMFKILTPEKKELECYPAKKGDKITSIAVKTYSPLGFSGNISLMIGFLPDGTIHKVTVVEQKETPGLGTKIEKPKFLKQFENKNPKSAKLQVKKDGGEIDAITAATISSRAFCDAVDRAYKSFMTYQNLNSNRSIRNE